VWPHPQQMTVSNDLLFVPPNELTIESNILTCDVIAKAIDRYKPIFFPPTFDLRPAPADAENKLQRLTLNIKGTVQCDKYIELNSSEACKCEGCSLYIDPRPDELR
jgi:hypothetical protein